MLAEAAAETRDPSANLCRDVAEDRVCTHSRLITSTGKALEASFLSTLIELLDVPGQLGRLHLIAPGDDGSCCHLNCGSRRGTAREHPPVPRRAFDCPQDRRIWLDSEHGVPNPNIARFHRPRCGGSPGAQGATP